MCCVSFHYYQANKMAEGLAECQSWKCFGPLEGGPISNREMEAVVQAGFQPRLKGGKDWTQTVLIVTF